MSSFEHRAHARFAAIAAAAACALGGIIALPGRASASPPTLTTLNASSFTSNSTAAGQWVEPTGNGSANGACLTAGPAATSSIPNCSPTNDASGSGALRLTTAGNSLVGAVFNSTSIPTSQGLDVTFDTYQFDDAGQSPADGLSFALAATDPKNPSPPAMTGPVGGSLGYSATDPPGNPATPGLPEGYLGIGLDVYGNYLDSNFQGSNCSTASPITSGQTQENVTIRGPGNGTQGYCELATSGGLGAGALDNPSATTRPAPVPVEIALNPSSMATTTASGVTVPAGDVVVRVGTLTAGPETVTTALPNLSGNSAYPSSWVNPATGLPYQLTFGWTASTGGSVEFHELNTLNATTLNGPLPVLAAVVGDTTGGFFRAGQSAGYTIDTSVAASGGSESQPPTVIDTLPTGLVPQLAAITASGWDCTASSGQTVSCTYPASTGSPIPAGTLLRRITVPVTVTSAAGESAVTDTAKASSNDADPTTASHSVTVEQLPGAPTGVSATAGDGDATVSWVPPSDRGDAGGVTGYVVTPYVNGSPQSPQQFPSAATSEKVTGLTPGTAYTFTVAAVNDVGTGPASSASSAVTPASAPSITSAPFPGGEGNVAYSVTPTTSGGTSPLQWSVSAGSVPPGLTLDTGTGKLSGSPTTAGTYPFTIEATDADGQVATQAESVTIAADPAITSPPFPGGERNVAYSVTPTTSGGTSPLQWSVSAGSVPPGLTLDTGTGKLSGTPTASAGTYPFTIEATDADGQVATQAESVTIAADPAITSAPFPGGEGNVAYSVTPTTSGGTSPLQWSVSAGSVPPGLTLDTGTGKLSGSPTTAGTYTFTIEATDADGQVATQAESVTIAADPTVTSPALPASDVGATYSVVPTTSGGTGPFAWSVTGGALPAGLGLDPSTGKVSGTPTTPGTSTFTLQAVDADGQVATQAESVTIAADPTVSSPALPAGEDGAGYATTPTVADGTGPFTWSVTGGGLPAGLSLDPSTGKVSGTPTTPGTSTFTLTVTDAAGEVASQAESVVVATDPSVTSDPAVATPVDVPYSEQLTTAGGTGPFTWSVTGGSLPAGVTLTPGGVLSGSPSTQGSTTFTVTVIDAEGQTATEAITLVAQPTALNSRLLAALPDASGYWITTSNGTVLAYGAAHLYGDLTAIPHSPIVGIAATPDGKGYWLVASDGGVFAFGDAGYYGSIGATRLAAPVVGLAATPDGKGYWLVASDGGVFAFGDAGYYGSTGATQLAAPMVGMASTPDGKGYWLVASDGGVFAFGDASFSGSAGGTKLAAPVVGMAATPDGQGYWLVASDGGIFAYGDAPFHGSGTNLPLVAPMTGMQATPDGNGYWLVAGDGGVFSYGDAGFLGSAPQQPGSFNGYQG